MSLHSGRAKGSRKQHGVTAAQVLPQHNAKSSSNPATGQMCTNTQPWSINQHVLTPNSSNTAAWLVVISFDALLTHPASGLNMQGSAAKLAIIYSVSGLTF